MSDQSFIQTKKIRAIVEKQLGIQRVKHVDSYLEENSDGFPIIRVNIIYSAKDGLTVDEMDMVFDAIWLADEQETARFPVIDFQEDTDGEPIASEWTTFPSGPSTSKGRKPA